MAEEAAILRQFLNGRILAHEAVAALTLIGYDADEAKEMVNEWANCPEDDCVIGDVNPCK